ncbi:hypothetical protein OQJ15_10450 [Fluoribacter dumoffii]|uniref:Uncharacterized protein n=1 Tax=Fluoribacter dumoffii TaxID=463 RepID=A0A377G706_9GAMM|nr:hypothetical protein [Fluoribacter dumoffii]KTC89477.1 hypothetical protein Ldum_0545 [Fluoribacter dumoffii NY 23]MCW8386727.1 hypothetical protein [Fluoribacter dumoffii]MCW8496930.1 hypothetical protein [Fluoribacter dumoffii]STO20586.1 Uncharacterised protein [Fluoribacter dumoffii]
MVKMILKRALILSLPVFTMNVHSGPSKEFLANQCYELSRVIVSLADTQEKKICINKLYMASVQMSTAALLIMEDSSDVAKEILNNAVAALQYAELLSCKQYIQISHSKFEAQKIKTLL